MPRLTDVEQHAAGRGREDADAAQAREVLVTVPVMTGPGCIAALMPVMAWPAAGASIVCGSSTLVSL